MIVVDASLAAKWFLREPETQDALQFLADHGHRLCGPDLLFSEVAGAIVRRANMAVWTVAEATEALEKWAEGWARGEIEAHRVTSYILYEGGKLALTLGHPLSDCIYLALAIELGCELATCDAKFRAKAVGLYPTIRLLADYLV